MESNKVKQFMKKAVSIVLSAAMSFSVIASVSAFDGTYKDGTYTGTGTGKIGDIVLSVTVSGGKVTGITEVSHEETASYWEKAKVLLSTIVEKQTTDVDTVSGATKSCDGIKEAVNNALAKAVDAGIFASGDGSEKNPYTINTAEQLSAFAKSVDDGETYEGKYVVLGENIDISGVENWNPIGAEGKSADNLTALFNGTFDGQGHKISGLKISGEYTAETNVGLFSTLNEKAVVKNVSVTGADINVKGADQTRAGVITGDTVGATKNADGTYPIGAQIDGCSAEGSVKTVSDEAKLIWAGGIAGRMMVASAVVNSYSDVDAHAESNGGSNSAYAGGIAGTTGNYTLVANCAVFGDNFASSPKSTNFGGMSGGIAGMFAGKQYNVYAMGNATIGNGGCANNLWIGTLDGEITSSGMEKQSDGSYLYPATGAVRAYGYYADDIVLTENVYNSELTVDSTNTVTPLQATGYSTKLTSYDKVYQTEALSRLAMAESAFAETLNKNISDINKILAAYAIDGIELREWTAADGKVLPNGDVWVNGEVDASIFESGTGTETDPYIIKTADQLTAFAGSMNAKIDYSDKFVALGGNVDISSIADWTPIGGSDYAFNGTFDGKGYKISGMKMGTSEVAKELTPDEIYCGLFGVLEKNAVVKNVNLTDAAVYVSYGASAYVGGIAGVVHGNTTAGTFGGAVIDSCSVSGTISYTAEKGNQFAGGIAGMQYKGAIINSSSSADVSCVVKTGNAIAEAGGLVGMNNRGLIANCYALGDVYGSASRSNGDEGMASVSTLVGVQAGLLANSYASGDVTTAEYSTYAGMVSGWVTGIGKSYNCWYNSESVMTVNGQKISPVEAIGTKVTPGVNDEGDAYIGGLVDKMTSYNSANYAEIATGLNTSFAAFPADVTAYGLTENALKNWVYSDEKVTFGDTYATVVYVQPDAEKVEEKKEVLKDGTWYGRDTDKTTVVKITVADGEITATEVLKGESEGTAYDSALAKAKEKAVYGDAAHYDAADTTKFAGGSGTKQDPYQIADADQLRYLSYSVNADVDWDNTYFVQTADIDLSKSEWTPIGRVIYAEINGQGKQYSAYPFKGNYDGGNYKITGMTVGTKENPADTNVGALFGVTIGDFTGNEEPTTELESGSVHLSNIHVENMSVNISTVYDTYTGGIVGSGQNGIYIDNCSAEGEINVTTKNSFARAGGIASNVLRGAVTNCSADVDINAVTDASNVYAGGMFALTNRATVINCYATGNVTGNSTNTNKVHIGGLTGQAGGIQINCYATGNVVSLKPTSDVGGVNGRMGGISVDYNCYFNSEAKQANGDTVNETAVSSGVAVNDALEVSVGKTKAELASEDFAQLLNTNNQSAETWLNGVIKEHISANDLVQQIYYNGSELNEWYLNKGVVGFTSPSETEKEAEELINALSGTYQQLFEGALFNEEYEKLWHDYCAVIVGEDNADMYAQVMKSSVGGSIYGEAAVEEYTEHPENTKFFCGFAENVANIKFDGTTISGTSADGEELFSHEYEFVEFLPSSDQDGFEFYIFETADENAGEFKYFALCADTPDSTYHIEFRYGSDKDELIKLYSGKYAYWVASGILTNSTLQDRENAISLFCLENMDYSAERTESSMAQISDLKGTWSTDNTYFIVDYNGERKTYLNNELVSKYTFYAYDNDGDDSKKSGIYAIYQNGVAESGKYELTESDGKIVLTLTAQDGSTRAYEKKIPENIGLRFDGSTAVVTANKDIAGATLVIAGYNSDDEMVGIKTLSADFKAGTPMGVSFGDNDEITKLSAFFWNLETAQALCESKSRNVEIK